MSARAADQLPRWAPRVPLGWVAVGVMAGLVAFVVSPALALGAGALAPFAVRHHRRARRRRQEQALAAALPATLDLCTVVLGAGGTIRDAVDAIAGSGPGPVRPHAEAALQRADAGHRFDQALRRLQEDLGPAFQPLTGALLLAHTEGGSVGELLGRLVTEANNSRRRLGELRARRLPVTLLVPLVVCSLPAVILGSVVPLALVALRRLDF